MFYQFKNPEYLLFFFFITRANTILFNNNFLASENFIENHVNRHPSQLFYDNKIFFLIIILTF